MLYFFDTFYTQSDSFSLADAIRTTVLASAKWCNYYFARILWTDGKQEPRTGALPEPLDQRQKAITTLLDWIEQSGHNLEDCILSLDTKPLDQNTSDWLLTLMPDQFAELQTAWAKAGLPTDLFYPWLAQKKVTDASFLGKFFSLMGLHPTRFFSPKEWAAYQIKQKS